MAPITKLEIVFGAMTFGKEGEEQVRTSNLADCAAILDTFQKHGHNEIDTSRFYGGGTSEEYLAALKWQERGLVMDTKFFPNVHGMLGRAVTHLDASSMRNGLNESLKALGGAEKVDLWYLHAPDRSIPLEDTLKAVDELYKEGKFNRWGISNFMSWEVAAICELCDRHGYKRPEVYQGVYNAVYRTIENELLPCLRKYNIAFYAFNPLAGGYLTDRYHRDTKDDSIEAGSRFDPKKMQGQLYRARFWNDPFFDALDVLRAATKEASIRESQAALRWIMHHSKLEKRYGDKIIIGASSEQQLKQNLEDFEKGPLEGGVTTAFDKGWELCRGVTWKYFH
ncbi:Aldo/keto reductase [Bimuria novae-zelandiae CBS 107.79]|uniref:Aldo/keto reductase n=1 Tax=Bimuria novae-zelandiae CBS 107.79 TaxID=1447943 RepID=A0A6A5VFP7_9PLEO|nr:Aldo/keto reductase [Bimuria novae-zelandiae CBS 107.79]